MWNGFTQAGVERLNDSIRNYVWAIVDMQGRTRTKHTQHRTPKNNSLRMLKTRLARLLTFRRASTAIRSRCSTHPRHWISCSELASPSDIALCLGNVQGYNNNILIAESNVQGQTSRHLRRQRLAHSKEKLYPQSGLSRGVLTSIPPPHDVEVGPVSPIAVAPSSVML